jgi:hypothetical protein
MAITFFRFFAHTELGSAGSVNAVVLAMRKSIFVLQKKRGRPATGRLPVTGVRLAPELRATVDRWAAEQPYKPSRSEAIRRLGRIGADGIAADEEAKPQGRIEGPRLGRSANRCTRRFVRNP